MATIQSRTAAQPMIQQEPPKAGWLRRAFDAVREAVSGPQITTASRTQGVDSYRSTGNREVYAPRSLNKLCNTGKGGNTKVLTAISNEYYLQLCDEIGAYSETPAPTRRA